MSNLLMWLPGEFLPLIIVGLGIAVMLGAIGLGRAAGIILLLVFAPLLGTIFFQLVSQLPWWMCGLVLLWAVSAMFTSFLSLIFGSNAAAHAAGSLVASGIRGLLGLIFLPIRLLSQALLRR